MLGSGGTRGLGQAWPGTVTGMALSLAAALCGGGGLFPYNPRYWLNCCYLLSVGAFCGPCPWLSVCPSARGRREVLPRPSHASHSACQSPNLPPPTLAPSPLPQPIPGARSHFFLSPGPDSLSCTRAPLLFGVIFGCHHCPLWSARIDRDGGFWGLASWFQAFGAKTCEGLWLVLWQ